MSGLCMACSMHCPGVPKTRHKMTQTLRFFRIDEGEMAGWYADVPGHTLEDNQMVSGSDAFLEEVDALSGGKGELTLTFGDSHDPDGPAFRAKLLMKSHDGEGASYILTGPMAEDQDAAGSELWICNVTHDVMGEHPECIYLYDMR